VRPGAPSVTAQKVALLRLSFERAPAAYGDPEADQRLGRDVAATSDVDSGTELSQYLAARTMFFDRVIVGALERGIAQVAIIGAGYDGRALRYAKPGVTWFEVDHPDTQRDKRARIERLGIDTSHVRFVAADFSADDVAAALRDSGFDPARPTVSICEGVAVYLDRPVLVSLLRSIRSVAAPGSRLAISLSMTPDSDEAAARQEWFRARVAAVGEPERSRLSPEERAHVLSDTGWKDETTSPRAQRAGLVVLSPT
jgi:methyltransferase (TIGR00027 family)